MQDRLGNDLAHRPTAEELVKKGILHREFCFPMGISLTI